MANINYYKCSRSGETTRQIEIRHRKLAPIKQNYGGNKPQQLLIILMECLFLFTELGFLQPYKCTKCGRVSNKSFEEEDKGHLAG